MRPKLLTKRRSISMPPEMYEKIEEIAAVEGRTTTKIMRDALRYYIAHYEKNKEGKNGKRKDSN